MKRVLLGLALSPLLLLASPQNLANISDLKESIALMIDRLNGLEKEMDILKKEKQDDSQKESKKTKEMSSELPSNIKSSTQLAQSHNDDFSKLDKKIKDLGDEIDKLKNKGIVDTDLDRDLLISIIDAKTQPSKDEIDKLKKQISDLENSKPSSSEDRDIKDDKSSSNKKELQKAQNLPKEGKDVKQEEKVHGNSQDKEIDLQEQFRDYTSYINRKIEELENKIITNGNSNASVASNAISPISQNPKTNECSYNCVSKADFSNYKFERIKKEKNLQEQIDILRKQIEELNKHIEEVKKYYEGS